MAELVREDTHPGWAVVLRQGWAGQRSALQFLQIRLLQGPWPHDVICQERNPPTQLPGTFGGWSHSRARKELVRVTAESQGSRGRGGRGMLASSYLGPHTGSITPRRQVSVLCGCGFVRGCEVSCMEHIGCLSDCMGALLIQLYPYTIINQIVCIGFLTRPAPARH